MKLSKNLLKNSFIVSLFCLIFLPSWSQSQVPEDIKYLSAFLYFPIIFLFINGKGPEEKTGTKFSGIIFFVFIVYIAYSLLNWYFLSSPYYGTRSMTYLVFCFMSFALGAFFLSAPEKFRIFLTSLIVSGVIVSIYSFCQYFAFIPYFEPEYWPIRITGLFSNKNACGIFIMNSSIWTTYLIFSIKNKNLSVALFAALIIQVVALFIAETRGVSFLSMVGFCAVLVPLVFKAGYLKSAKVRYLLYAVFFLGMLVPLYVWNETTWIRLAGTTLHGDPARWGLYQAEWKLFLHHPVFGCGIGNFVHDVVPFWSDSFRKSVAATFFANAESDFLETLTEEGIVGFGLYIFFLFGAIVLGVRELKRAWKWESYILLVLFCLMLIDGIWDTPLRRIPCNIVFWAMAGYFWRNYFLTAWKQIPRKAGTISGIAVLGIYCVLALFFVRIIIGDYFFLQSYVSSGNLHPQSGKQIKRALAVCPFHPDALFQAGFIAIRTQQYDFAREVADRLEKTAPNYRPTSFLKACCAFGKEDYVTALSYVNEEIARNPNYWDAYDLKVKTLSMLGRCKEMGHMKDSLLIPLKNCKDRTIWYDTVSAITLKSQYLKETGKVRAFLGGNCLRQAYRRYIALCRSKAEKSFRQLQNISKIQCGK
jgi:Lipid A core - O-antigen ligase and related enzymes